MLVALALEAGAWAARLTGGGFGGSIVVLAPVERCAGIGAAVAAGYLAATGRVTEPIVARAAAGARRLANSGSAPIRRERLSHDGAASLHEQHIAPGAVQPAQP